MTKTKEGRSTVLSVVIRTVIAALFIFLYYWFDLPAFNLRSPQFWTFLVVSMIVTAVIFSFGGLLRKLREQVAASNGKVTPVSPRTLLGKVKNIPLVYRLIAVVAIVVIAVFLLSSALAFP